MKKSLITLVILLITCTSFTQINEAFKFKVTSPYGHTDETVLRFHNDATAEFDGMWDAWKMFTWNDSVPSLFSNTASDGMLSINSIDFPLKDTSMTLEMKVPLISGVYTFESEQLGSLPADVKLAVRDVETGVSYPLDQNQSFTFNVTADPVNMIERLEVYISTVAEVTVDSTHVVFENEGCNEWSLNVLDAANSSVVSEMAFVDTWESDSLDAGLYTAYVTDSYGITDTLAFEVIAADSGSDNGGEEEENEEDNGEASDKDNESYLSMDGHDEVAPAYVMIQYGEAYLISLEREVLKIDVYSMNGAKIDTVQPTDAEKVLLSQYDALVILHVQHKDGDQMVKYIK